jgi:hypothetical protein
MVPPDSAYDDATRQPPKPMGWLDRQFANTGLVILVLFALCCGEIALIFGLVGAIACEHPRARRNAQVVLAVGIARFVLAIIYVILNRQAALQ